MKKPTYCALENPWKNDENSSFIIENERHRKYMLGQTVTFHNTMMNRTISSVNKAGVCVTKM